MQLNYYILFLLFILSVSCHKKDRFTTVKTPDKSLIDSLIQSLKIGENLALEAMKTLKQETNFEKDTYPYYLRIFTITGINEVFAATATFEPEKVSFYKKRNDDWHKIIAFEVDLIRAYEVFSRMEDFNFDGYNDIALHYSTSNGCASEYFQLFLYEPSSNNFKYIKQFSELGCPIALYGEKVIKSRHASCGCGCFVVNVHKWNGNTLELVKDIVKDNHHDTLITSFYNSFGKTIKQEKKIINFEDAQKILDYYPFK